jgi:hypothetical protein
MSIVLFVLNVSRWMKTIFDIYFNTWVYPAAVLSLATVVTMAKSIEDPIVALQVFLWECLWLTACWCAGRSAGIVVDMWRSTARK